jgi:DNA-binding response OmpR family regulator/anti-sigma regulatory factor (Ser/Thr protein kinase)
VDKSKNKVEIFFNEFKNSQLVAVFKIDLVKSTKKGNEAISIAQNALEEIFEESIRILDIQDVITKYEGDSYFFTFYKDGIIKIVDFINYSIPELIKRLKEIKQNFRAGLDIGIVTLKRNEVTKSIEHFDLPGIQAARLEKVASNNQILCTRRVFDLFSNEYPKFFTKKPKLKKTKDRKIISYELKPFQSDKIRAIIRSYLLTDNEKVVAKSQYPKFKILVVDDEDSIRVALQIFLENMGYYVKTAESGISALEIIAEEDFDLIISDIRMGKMDGVELIKEIRRLNIATPVFIITAYPEINSAIVAIKYGVVEYIAKPFDMHEIQEKILSFSNRSRTKLNTVLKNSGIKLPSEIKEKLLKLLDDILKIKNRSSNIGEHLNRILNHKISNLVDDFCKNIHSSEYAIINLQIQIEHIDKIIKLLINVNLEDFLTSLKTIIQDITLINESKIVINLKSNLDEVIYEKIDGRLLILLIYELLDNAIDAMQKQGDIDIVINHLKSLDQINVDVKDNGPGLETSTLNEIIEKKYTTKGAGHGIGLNLVNAVIVLLGGKLSYTYDGGAKFSFSIDTNKIFLK